MTDLKGNWNECIRLNNLGVRYLEQGMLDPARKCFRQAAEFCQVVSYESSVDGFGVYPNQWVSLYQAFPSIPVYTGSCDETDAAMMIPLHPAALSIGQQELSKEEDTPYFVPDVERRWTVLTSRLDWIIDFNLATTLEVSAFLQDGSRTSHNLLLQEAYEIFEEMSEDVAEWNNYSASVDIVIFLMMMFQSQRMICDHLGNVELASRFLMRIRHFQQAISAQLLQKGNMQRVIFHLSRTGQFAPSS